MTRRSSLRASAREIYAKLAEGEAGALKEAAPDPPSPCSGATDLTARVRALYEDSAVPVAKIAALAGVTERTIYKYAVKQDWKRRYLCAPRDAAVARANRGRRWQRASGHAPAKGAGGRFIARADQDKPFARGLKATDPAGAERAMAACDEASRLSGMAQARALRHKRWEAQLRAIEALNRAFAGYNGFMKAQARQSAKAKAAQSKNSRHRSGRPGRWRARPPGQEPFKEPFKEPSKEPPRPFVAKKPSPRHAALERLHVRVIEVALAQWQALQAAASAPSQKK